MNRRRTAEEIGIVHEALRGVEEALAEWGSTYYTDTAATLKVLGATAGAVAKLCGTVSRILSDQVEL